MALKVDNPALNFITAAENTETDAAPAPQNSARQTAKTIAPPLRKADNKGERYNLLLKVTTKIKLQKFIEREGYKSANDYINYLLEVALANEPEPTAAEIRAYKKEAEARKLK